MTVEEYLKEENPSIEILRKGLAAGCSALGIRQDTCLALTLLLDSRWALVLMLSFMVQEEEKGRRPDTTEIVLMAEKIKDADIKRKAIEKRKRLQSKNPQ